jgi:hypothetical protein
MDRDVSSPRSEVRQPCTSRRKLTEAFAVHLLTYGARRWQLGGSSGRITCSNGFGVASRPQGRRLLLRDAGEAASLIGGRDDGALKHTCCAESGADLAAKQVAQGGEVATDRNWMKIASDQHLPWGMRLVVGIGDIGQIWTGRMCSISINKSCSRAVYLRRLMRQAGTWPAWKELPGHD